MTEPHPVSTEPEESTAIVHTTPRVHPAEVSHGTLGAWDPFQLMDRLDEDLLRKELEGIASTELVYVVKEGGQEVVGLSKVGVDEGCMVLVAQGQVIREEEIQYEVIGEGEEREALFKAKAARFAVAPDGTEVRLDQVIGVKRQPLYYEQVPLSLDAKAPGKKYRGKTFRELLEFDEGRDYLAWMAENFSDEAIRGFVRRILSGEVVEEVKAGRKLNPHWFEHGCMKASRNARFRLIPGSVRAQIIARARQAGGAQVREVGRDTEHRQPGPWRQAINDIKREAAGPGAPAERAPEGNGGSNAGGSADRDAYAPTEKQIAFFQRLADSPVFSEEERARALEWLATRATRQTIKDQIDWLKGQVEKRRQA